MINPSAFGRRAALWLTLAVSYAAFGQADYSTPYTVSKFAGLTGIAANSDGTINYAQFNLPLGITLDSNGNLYVADSGNDTIRKVTAAGITSTLAGSVGFTGIADGTGSAANFKTPSGVAVDGAGNIYVTDSLNHTIRRVTAAGVVTTLAGLPGVYGSVDATGTTARLNNPMGIALSSAGDLYVADTNNHTIRKVTTAGVVTTFAGTAGVAGSADGTGVGASFRNPFSLAFDASGNLFVSDSGNNTVRKITPAGSVTTLAGGIGVSGSADGTGTAARFNAPEGLAVDASGNVFVADSGNSLIRKISSAGVVTTVAGSVGGGRSVDGTGAGAKFQNPAGLVVDGSGTLWVADFYNHTIRKVTAAGVVTTFAGASGSSGSVDGTGNAATFDNPYGIAIDPARNIYIADRLNQTIRKVSAAGVVRTLAGLAGVTGSVDGTGSAARFNYPFGVAADASGNVYVADSGNQSIRKITPAGVVTTLAGSNGLIGSADGTGSSARFFSPSGVAVDTSGNLYVADSGNHTIRKITPAGVVTTLAGSPLAPGSANGTGSAARFFSPYGVAVDAGGNVLVADSANHLIRKITAAGVVTTVAGQTGVAGSRDGSGALATFNFPLALSFDGAGNLYIADYQNTIVRMITAAGLVKTVAGTAGIYGSDDGTGAAVQFYDVAGVAADTSGVIYVVDSSNNLIRKGLPPGAANITKQPASQTVSVGQSVTFSVTASGSGLTYQWQKNGANISGANGASYTISPVQLSDAGTYAVVIASSTTSVTSLAATLGFNSAPTITTQPASVTASVGQSATFAVTTTGDAAPTFQWQKNGVNIAGAVGASYTIGSVQASDAGSYAVIVTGSAGTVTSSAATLTVNSVAINPGRLTNLSVLTDISAAVPSFTAGITIGGASGTEPLLVRAAGPSLGALGVPGTLADPKLDFYSGQTVIATNDNWGGGATLAAVFAQVGAFPYASATSKDAAVFSPAVVPGGYTVIVSGVGGTIGTAIAEVYDATPTGSYTASSPHLTNVSVLKQISVGGSLTLGFTIGGSTSKTVLIRAIGPALGLAPFSIAGAMTDPQLTLYNSANAVIQTNDNWGGDAAVMAAIAATGAFPVANTASKDAMLVATLAPGGYTAAASGVGGVGGFAIVEVYEVP